MSSPSRNGLPIWADGHRVHQSPDGTLLIHNLRARDEGSYTCSTYRGSQAVSRSTEVKVVPPGEKSPCSQSWLVRRSEEACRRCGPRDSVPARAHSASYRPCGWGERPTLPEPHCPGLCSGFLRRWQGHSEDEGSDVYGSIW